LLRPRINFLFRTDASFLLFTRTTKKQMAIRFIVDVGTPGITPEMIEAYSKDQWSYTRAAPTPVGEALKSASLAYEDIQIREQREQLHVGRTKAGSGTAQSREQ
jgi:hypothetical protein